MKAIYNGHDVFVWLPTGMQESLLPSPTVPGRVSWTPKSIVLLVVSPLATLMIDQVKTLRKKGVSCSIVTSSGGIEKETPCT